MTLGGTIQRTDGTPPFIGSHHVVAAGATIRVANGCTVTKRRPTSDRGPHRALAGELVRTDLIETYVSEGEHSRRSRPPAATTTESHSPSPPMR